jgi:undecaprenyl-diphosphatase
LLFYQLIKNVLLQSDLITVVALALGGVVLIAFEWWHKEREDAISRIEDVSIKKAVIIGVCQALAVIPGVSRAAATIVGGMALNLRRETIVQFSFLLAIPTMLAATVLDLGHTAWALNGQEVTVLLVGFVTAFFVALTTVEWLLRYIKKHTFIAFGVYRILAALVFYFVFIA